MGDLVRCLALSVVASVLAACGGGSSAPSEPPAPASSPPLVSQAPGTAPAMTGAATPDSPRSGLVAVIVMENQSPADVLGLPYLRSLARQGAVLTNYRAVAHPSLPNYLALTSGDTFGVRDDAYRVLPGGADLGHQLTAAGISWRAYMESMTDGCRDSPEPYAVRHNPFAYYGGACPASVVPFKGFASDLRAPVPPRFVWITPNLCDDDHDCPPTVGDRWLSGVVPQLLASPGYAQHGLVAVVWDEGRGSSDGTPAVIVSPDLRAHASSARHDHYSLLAAVEDRLGLPRLGRAVGADALTDVLGV